MHGEQPSDHSGPGNHSASCFHCGSPKPRCLDACVACGRAPATREERAQSLALSTDFIVQSNELGNEDVSESWQDLHGRGQLIKELGSAHLPRERIELAARQIDLLEALTPHKVVLSTVLWLLPVMLVAVVVAVLSYSGR